MLKTIIPNTPTQIWITAQAIRALSLIPAPLRRRLTSFSGNAAAMLNDAHLRRPEDLTPHQ